MIKKLISWSIKNKWMVIIMYSVMIIYGIYSVYTTPVDAIPDLSENQVIIYTEWMGRNPQIIEDQITYPLTSNLQGIPRQVRHPEEHRVQGEGCAAVLPAGDVLPDQ